MAVTGNDIIPARNDRTPFKPLPGWMLTFRGLIRPFLKTGAERLRFDRKINQTLQYHALLKQRRETQRNVEKQYDIIGQQIVATWTRLGERSDRNYEGVSDQRRDRRKKITKVQFEVGRIKENSIWFRIMVTRRGLFAWKSALPYRVFVTDLISDVYLAELSTACNRPVTAVKTDTDGVWIVVHLADGIWDIPERVLYKDVLSHYPADMSKGTFVVGVGERKKIRTLELDDLPHGLIAGTTKSGKSNMVNNIIASFIRFIDASDLMLVLIDLKRMEFNHFRKIPHLRQPVIIDAQTALRALSEIREELDRRADLLSDRNVKNLSTWNDRYPAEKLARIVVFIDEFAELVSSGNKTREQTLDLVKSISALGRAVGVHLIICTQTPDKTVLPRLVRNNMQWLIGGRCGDPFSSAIIIGTHELFTLTPIKGRMMTRVGPDKMTLQTPYITDDDIAEAVAIANGRGQGVIKLEGVNPIIDTFGLLAWIVNKADGKLTVTHLYPLLRDYCITRPMIEAFISDCRKAGDLWHGRKHYRIVNELVTVDDPDAEIPPDAVTHDADGDPLPPPEQVWAVLQPPPRPKPRYDMTLNSVDVFIDEFTVKGGEQLSRELYAAYCGWVKDTEYLQEKDNVFGRRLTKLGYGSRRGTDGVAIRTGLHLKSNEAMDDETGHTTNEGQATS